MKKVLALASVGAFVLSLAGASLAQEKAPAPAAPAVGRRRPRPGGAEDGGPGGSEDGSARGSEGRDAKATKKARPKSQGPKKSQKGQKGTEEPRIAKPTNPGPRPEFGPLLGDEFRRRSNHREGIRELP